MITHSLNNLTSRAGILFLAFIPLGARQDPQVCGAHPERLQEELTLHRQSRLLRAWKAESAQARTQRSVVRDVGNIALIDDSDGVVARRNRFNLDRRTLRFLPTAANAARYRFEVADGGYDAAAASSGTPLDGLGDDDSRSAALPFSFSFFGKSYTRLNVNSDGNLTFDGPDTASTERSLGRMTAGLPRIAAMFMDHDPSAAANSVRVFSTASRFTVSWIAVPEYQSFGTGPPNTFQIGLLPDGRIEFAYQGISSLGGVVGIAPGNLQGVSNVVSFSTGDSREFSSAVAERFSNVDEVDIVFTAQKFYETHDDAYDYLVIYNNIGLDPGPGVVAFEVTTRSDRRGIGDTPVDHGKDFGSPRRLQAVLNLGRLTQYPRDPNGIVAARSTSGDTPVTILGHEAGHLWLATASVRDPANPTARPMLGSQMAHWAFNFNSEASLLEGNRIRDNGPGAVPRFTTVATVEGYAPLDQYLMGLRAPEEVPPSFYVANSTAGSGSRAPQPGVSFDGVRRDVTIEEIVDAEGRRIPDHMVSQRRFRFAFILITAAGVEPTAEQLAQLEGYRQAFEPFFQRVTGDRAFADTSLKKSLQLSLAPAAGVIAGRSGTASLSLRNPAAAAVTAVLRTQNGAASAPASVMIPAGQQRVTFTVSGVRPGVEELTAEPDDTRYATAYARVQVLGSADALRLTTASGDKQQVSATGTLLEPVVFRVVDQNNLAYPGFEVTALASSGGSVQPARATSDEDGLVRFTWTPGPGPLLELQARLVGLPAPALTATAIGKPLIQNNGVVNSASYSPAIVPGGLSSIFGFSLAGGVTASATLPLTDRLGGVRVLLNGLPAQLLYVSDRQINFLAPAGLGEPSLEVVVTYGLERSPPFAAAVKPVDPGIFFDAATGLGAILVAGTGRTTAENPAGAGDVLEVYATGLGAVRASTTVAGLQETVTPASAFLGGVDAEVMFSGLAPGFPGLYQVNVRVPAGVPAGMQPLTIRMGSATSNEVRVGIR